ncbi:MAG: hypothetical protein ABI378_09320 [Chitinophagaceae bacterium]
MHGHNKLWNCGGGLSIAADNFEAYAAKGLKSLAKEIEFVMAQLIICLGQKMFKLMRKTSLIPTCCNRYHAHRAGQSLKKI